MVSFDPLKDIPDLTGKVFLVTGGNSGLGEATCAAIAQHNPGKLYLGARSLQKAEEAITRIRATSESANKAKIEILDIDLASFESIIAAANRINTETDRLDVLILNGGIVSPPHSTTKDGYEIQFGTNYMGHALLTQLLMPKLLSTQKAMSLSTTVTPSPPQSDVRIVVISSISQKRCPPTVQSIFFDNLTTPMSTIKGYDLYSRSNLARSLFAYELSKKYPQVTVSSLHPGFVRSNIWDGAQNFPRWMLWLFVMPALKVTGVSTEEGARNQLWCAFGDGVESGAYYEPVGVRADGGQDGGKSIICRDDGFAARLWEWTEEELSLHGGPGWVVG